MTRGVGVTAVLSDLPATVGILFALITQLGDLWFVFSVGALVYWLGRYTPGIGAGLTRQRAAMVLALLAAAVALTVSLKVAVALPRPSAAGVASEATLVPEFARGLYVSMATGEGYGFPSGHATVAVLMWGGFAWAVRVGRRRRRLAVAGTVIALVALSRLVIGVHYAVDVVAGAAVGSVFLWLAVGYLRTPERVFGASALVALAGLPIGGLTHDIGAVIGMSLAGTAIWTALPAAPDPTRRGALATVALGALSVGALLAAALFVVSEPISVAALAAVSTGLLLALPLVGERVAKK